MCQVPRHEQIKLKFSHEYIFTSVKFKNIPNEFDSTMDLPTVTVEGTICGPARVNEMNSEQHIYCDANIQKGSQIVTITSGTKVSHFAEIEVYAIPAKSILGNILNYFLLFFW